MEISKELLEEFINRVLDDDEGISEKAYDTLCMLVHETPELNSDFMNKVECTNERFYIS